MRSRTFKKVAGPPSRDHFQMMTKKTIGFLGAGKMAEALIKGLIASGTVSAGQLVASERNPERAEHMAELYEIKVFSKSFEVASASDVVIIAVKPQEMEPLLKEVGRDLTGDKLLISIAAGKTTGRIKELLGRSVPIVRVMPNTPALVGEGAIGLYAAPGVSDNEVRVARAIFEAVGTVVEVTDESLIDAVTGLSGSGPAYVFLFMEALVRAGVKAGLGADEATRLAVQTTFGAAKLAMESDKTLAELREMVTSPKGTTFEGLKKLEEGGFSKTVEDAVEAAAKRSRELS